MNEKTWTAREIVMMDRGAFYILSVALENLTRPWAWGPFGLGLHRGVPEAWEVWRDVDGGVHLRWKKGD